MPDKNERTENGGIDNRGLPQREVDEPAESDARFEDLEDVEEVEENESDEEEEEEADEPDEPDEGQGS